ncbi:hypothetical protein [Conyzicola sp.]|uniref:hypothetical protein n=1 Tax=Conyzicola sp. TaxID=1969404 RepID=UPI00398953F0
MSSNTRHLARVLLAAMTVAALALAVPSPASADPWKPGARQYAGVGAESTSVLWDVLTNGRANIADGTPQAPDVASFNATGSPTIVTKPGATPISRPTSEAAGFAALRDSPEQVDFVRSANRPVNIAGVADDAVTYLPIARDAVSVAGFRLVPGLDNFTREELTAIYTCTSAGNVRTSVFGTNAVVVYDDGAYILQQLRPQLPAAGTDVRAFFLRAIGVTTPGACVRGGSTTPENDARVLSVQGQIIPFLASQWIAQKNNMVNRTMTVDVHTLVSINGERPIDDRYNPQQPPLMPGPLFGRGAYPPGTQRGVFTRDVYAVVRTADLESPLTAALTAPLATGTGQLALNRSGYKRVDYLAEPRQFLGAAYPG